MYSNEFMTSATDDSIGVRFNYVCPYTGSRVALFDVRMDKGHCRKLIEALQVAVDADINQLTATGEIQGRPS